jgi:site-specific DNA recombinase
MKTLRLRCAVYTRKSSEEGLEQSFNSLHAQREACEAYIKSQVGEGWTLHPMEYDDGGFSGGNTDRPALKRLLADIERGQIDVVVVYKVDRLTRSLTDFARIVDVFDRSKVSFVSITQSFNTTTSMGRLTLNVLLSFAQFEREVTGERIRDKIAQSKAKGLWMGGVLPLGYDSKDHVLVVNAAEAQTVGMIFRRYLELKSVQALAKELEDRGIRSKAWVTSKGKPMGGMTFTKGSLYHLLQNDHYRGQIKHKDKLYPGQHAPILDAGLFDAAQAMLFANKVRRRNHSARVARAPLVGMIFDGEGRPFTPTFSVGSKGKTYRYYVAELDGSGGRRRLPADQLERFLLDLMRRVARRPELSLEALLVTVSRIEVRPASVLLACPADALFGTEHPDIALDELASSLASNERAILDSYGETVRISTPTKLSFRGGQTWISGAEVTTMPRCRPNPALVKALRSAHAVLASNGVHPTNPIAGASSATAPPNTYLIRLSKLAFLAPDLQREILEGRQPRGLSVRDLVEGDMPLAWQDQRLWFRQIPQRSDPPRVEMR